MKFVLYSLENCPFCKHFRRIFKNTLPDGDIMMLDGHSDNMWIEKNIDFVPTVVAYENGEEVDRISAEKLVGIRYPSWQGWISKYGVDA
jgi:glutaredoxin